MKGTVALSATSKSGRSASGRVLKPVIICLGERRVHRNVLDVRNTLRKIQGER
jgi:hypothetical protein